MNSADAYRQARALLNKHGATAAFDVLTIRVIAHHVDGRTAQRDATQRVIQALHELTRLSTEIDILH